MLKDGKQQTEVFELWECGNQT